MDRTVAMVGVVRAYASVDLCDYALCDYALRLASLTLRLGLTACALRIRRVAALASAGLLACASACVSEARGRMREQSEPKREAERPNPERRGADPIRSVSEASRSRDGRSEPK
jgi:hypothetical protein